MLKVNFEKTAWKQFGIWRNIYRGQGFKEGSNYITLSLAFYKFLIVIRKY